ncbi:plastocyanin/azurin family copper-binding protein [Haladaptatus sp. NG-SE-30]
MLKLTSIAVFSGVGVTSVAAHGDETTTTTQESHGHDETETGHHSGTTTSGHGSTTTDGGHGHGSDGGHDDGHGHDDGGGHDEGTDHEDGHGDSHSSIGKATDHATVTMATNGSIIDVLTGELGLSKYLTENRNHFHPHVVHVKKGGTVTWKSKSGRHAVVAYHPDIQGKPKRIPKGAKPWDSGAMTSGTFSRTFEIEGIYDYYCPPHEQMGMIGSIVVGNPDIHDQPGLRSPSNHLPSRVRTKLQELNVVTKTALRNGGEH